MSKVPKTTEFSAHISRSKMRRYLHDKLNAADTLAVETHLRHCERCSQSIISYIQEEEPENYQTHLKKLKGVVIETVQPKEPRFTAVQIKSMRAAAAVVVLLTFSFYAFDNLIDKDFSLAAKAEKQEESFKRKSVFPEETKKQQNDNPATKQLEAAKYEQKPEVKQAKAEALIAQTTPKKVKNTEPKPTKKKVAKAKEPKKKEVQKQVEPVPSATNIEPVSRVAQKTTQKEDPSSTDVDKAEEVSEKKEVSQVAQVQEEAVKKESLPEPIAPIQKLEKVDLKKENSNITGEKPAQVIPSTSVGQLPQRK